MTRDGSLSDRFTVFTGSTEQGYLQPTWEKFGLHISIHHWQLKNLICCPLNDPEDTDSLYFVSGRTAARLNLETLGTTLKRPPFSFGPRCLTADYGWIVVGGPYNGQISFHRTRDPMDHEVFSTRSSPFPGAERFAETALGGSIMNGCFLYRPRKDDQVRGVLSNNDETVKIFNLESRETQSQIDFPTAMNFSCLDPDNKVLLSVGDTNEIFLHTAPNGGSRSEQMTVLHSPDETDSAFHASFSASGTYFCIGHQNAAISVWDMRFLNDQPLHYRKTDRRGPNGAIRTCKFAPPSAGPVDLLLYAEATNQAHLLDTRDFEKDTILSVPSGHELSGSCWSACGRHMYVASDVGVHSWSVDTRSRMCFPQVKYK